MRYKFDPNKGIDLEMKNNRISPSALKARFLITAVGLLISGVYFLVRGIQGQ